MTGGAPDWPSCALVRRGGPEVEDVVLTKSGDLKGVVAEVGGFLDIGDKHVMLKVDDVDLVPLDDQSFVLITKYSEDELEEMPGVDEGWWD